jgi:hypothetical protein
VKNTTTTTNNHTIVLNFQAQQGPDADSHGELCCTFRKRKYLVHLGKNKKTKTMKKIYTCKGKSLFVIFMI